jgi:hypothetical protein
MAAAVFLAVSGGVRTTVGGLRISARSPLPIAILAVANFTIWFVAARKQHAIASDLDAAWSWLERHGSASILTIAIASTTVAAIYSTRSAAGADASGYVSQAEMWQRLEWNGLESAQGLDGWIGTPLGWRPASASTQVPTYAPGLPLLMAIPHAVAGITGAAAVVIVSAAITTVACGLMAMWLGGSIAGIIAAALVGFTPVFLYQAIQPMSDVPVTAAWMLCFAWLTRKGSWDLAAGIACAIAVLIRPNLAPLAIVPLFLARRKIAFATPVAVAGVFLAIVQSMWYGSPLRSGYGTAEELFALSNIGANAARYSQWFIATAPAMLLGIFAINRLKRNRHAMGMLLFAVLVIAAYLIYAVFDHWSYLRFLLPALAVFAIVAGVELAAWVSRFPAVIRTSLLFVLLVGLTAYSIFVARSFDTFKLADQLGRVARVAGFLHANAPPTAVILSGEQSGSMRYYTKRSILRWEAATPETLTAAIAKLDPVDQPIFIVLDAWEDAPFKAKFASLPAVALDWPPMLEAGTSHRTRVWKLADRDRFLRGEPLDIKRIR